MGYVRLGDGPEEAVEAMLRGSASGVSVETSGSTGRPRTVRLSRSAVMASAEASLERLGGPGRWLLALPADRIGGAQVLVRSALAGSTPITIAPGSFSPREFAVATAELVRTSRRGLPLYTSLVPTQVHRLLSSPAGRDSLRAYSAILVGGASLGSVAKESISHAIETYGATETSGGCVYDGIPLPGAQVSVDGEGRIALGGEFVADGYEDGRDDAFFEEARVRWYRTPDLGVWAGGRLSVRGRLDDVIVTGGLKVHPSAVEDAFRACLGVDQVVVIGLPDSEWGARIIALTEPRQPALSTSRARELLASVLPPHALPWEIRQVSALPLLANGKIDRKAAAELAADSLGKDP